MNAIFLLEFEDRHELAMTFLRVQEFYESHSDKFMKKKFSFNEYKEWYKSQSVDGEFTYSSFWGGFNVPSRVIENCYSLHDERLDADNFFLKINSICKNISELKGYDEYYLIGTRKGDLKALPHEIAHGLYTTNKEYRNLMNKGLQELDSSLLNKLKEIIENIGYGEDTLLDEAHAYLATGLVREMKREEYYLASEYFKKVYDSYVSDFILPNPLFEASTQGIDFPK